MAHRSRRFAKVLRWLGIRHISTRPRAPGAAGKAERFIQSLLARMGLRPRPSILRGTRRRPAALA